MTNVNFLKALNSFSPQNNAPNFLSRKSGLTSRVHAVSWIHNKDFVLPPPALGFVGGRTLFNLFHRWLLKTRSWDAGALERPNVTYARPRQPISAQKSARLVPKPPRAVLGVSKSLPLVEKLCGCELPGQTTCGLAGASFCGRNHKARSRNETLRVARPALAQRERYRKLP